MKLYLSSQGVGERTTDLLRLVGDNTHTAVVANAVDNYDSDSREARIRKEKRDLRQIGLHPEELDLRDFFGDPEGLSGQLALYGLIWIRGGNAYTLRRAMIEAGFDRAARDSIKSGSLVYGGYSAALAVAGPDLFGSELVDDPYEIPANYPDKEPPISALRLIDYYLAPHYMTNMPWRQSVLNYIIHMRANDKEVVCLQDGEVHIVEQTPQIQPLVDNIRVPE